MKLDAFGGDSPDKNWFLKLLDFTRNKISFLDNLDGRFVDTNIGTAETEIGHTLGRIPQYIFEVASFPNGTAGISFTKPSTATAIYMKRAVAGKCTLFIV